MVKAYTIDGSEVSADDRVDGVRLYIFDVQGIFVEQIVSRVGSLVTLDASLGENLTVVCWANGSGGSNSVFPTLVSGLDRLSDCTVDLTHAKVRASESYNFPGDYFYGKLSFTAADRGIERELDIRRKTGSMTITVRNLDRLIGLWESGDVTLVVSKTYHRMSFDGAFVGSKEAAYRPSQAFYKNGVYSTGIFNLYPSEDGIDIALYFGSELIVRVNSLNGLPIQVASGVTTNVLLDFKDSFSVQVAITSWGEEPVWKEF